MLYRRARGRPSDAAANDEEEPLDETRPEAAAAPGGSGMSEAYPRFEDAPWRELRLAQEASAGPDGERPALAFRLAENGCGWPVLSGSCPAERRAKPIVYDKPFSLHGGYLFDLWALHPEALPDLPAAGPGAAGPGARRLSLTMRDGTVREKDVPDGIFEQIAERLVAAMRAEDRSDSKRRREAGREEYRVFAAVLAGDLDGVRALVAAEPGLVNAVAPEKPADTKWMSPLEVALSAGGLRDPFWYEEVNWKRDIAWFLLEHGADVNYRAPRTARSFDAPVLFAAAVNAVRNVRQRRAVSDGRRSLAVVRTGEESDDAFAFLKAMLDQGADAAMLDHDGRNVLREALWEAGKVAGADSPAETRDDLLRVFRLLIDAGADRENVAPRTGQSIRESLAGDPVWPICAELFG